MKHALVTGSAGAIGADLVDRFLARNHRVLGIDRREPKGRAGDQSRCAFLRCDLSRSEDVERVLGGYQTEHGPFDIVVNAAGAIFSAPLLSIDSSGEIRSHDFKAWDETIASNLDSTFYVSAVTARAMLAKKVKGVIVNLSSVCAGGNAGQAAYSAAKAGVNGLTRALGKELGPFGIRVVAIAPGFIDTSSTRAALSGEKLSRIQREIPLRELGTLEALWSAVEFVVGNDYITGKVLELDGGLCI